MKRLETTARPNRRPGKIYLKPGHSPLDWARLKSSGKDLRGDVPDEVYRMGCRITREELSKHNTKTDCWTSLNGRVYNITPYLDFHPGGVPQIMRAAGKDGTQLFNEYHHWVNDSMMLDKCAVGILVP